MNDKAALLGGPATIPLLSGRNGTRIGIAAVLEALAVDVGRMRRRAEPGSYEVLLGDRLAGNLETVVNMLTPTAGELAAADVSVEEALDTVDERTRELRRMLGEARP